MTDLSIAMNRPPAGAHAAKSANAPPSSTGEPASDGAFKSVFARSVDASESNGADADSKTNDDEDDKSSSEEAGTMTPATTPIASDKPTTPSDAKRSQPGQSTAGTSTNIESQLPLVVDTLSAETPVIGGAAKDPSVEQRNLPVGKSAVLAANASVDIAAFPKAIATAATLQINQLDSKAALPMDKSRTERTAVEQIIADLGDLPGSDRMFSTPSTDTLAHPAFRSLFGALQHAAAQEVRHYDIQSSLSSPEWSREAGHVVRMMVTEKVSEAEIRIDPPELGPIDVALKVDGDSTTITFTANSPETRSLLEFHLPKLREALDAAGLHLADASVNSGGTQRDSRGTSGSSASSQKHLSGSDSGSQDSKSVPGPGFATSTRSDRLIDIFA